MFIKSIHMTDYKRFHDLTIDLGESPKRIVALVGPNGCGKSSVFDALIYYYVQSTGSFGANSNNDYHYHSLSQNPAYSRQNISINFLDGSFENVFRSLANEGLQRSIISFRSSYRFNSSLHVQEIKSINPILLNNYGASTASDIDQRIEQSYRRLQSYYTDYQEEKNARPSEAKSYILGELNKAISKCVNLEIVSLGNVANNEGTLFFKKSDSNAVFQFNVLSAGEKEVVDLLVDLFLRKTFYKNSIYIIDEPELHIHTAAQRPLLREINNMVPENCQIWIATHSIGFLRALQDEFKDIVQIIEFPAENKWASESYTLVPSIPSHSMWTRVFATALDDLTTLICPKTIVYCEGRDVPGANGKERGLDAQVYNTIFAKKYPDVLFVSSGGNTELDQRSDIALAILSKVFPDLQILVLKDRDMASGKPVSEHDRLVCLDVSSPNMRILKRFEIENYLYDPSVLEAYCAQNSLAFDADHYSRVVENISDQELKIRTSEIKNCCGVVGSISADRFKLCLSACFNETMAVYKELEDVIFKRM